MIKKKSRLPNFNKMTREEEAKWFDSHDLGDYWDELKDVNIVWEVNKPREETIIVRVQKNLKDRITIVAREKGLNVSTLTRMWLIEKLQSIK